MHEAAAAPVAEIGRLSLADLLRWRGPSANRLLLCESRSHADLRQAGDFWLHSGDSGVNDLDGDRRSIAIALHALTSSVVEAFPRSIRQLIAASELIVIDAKLAGTRVSEILAALDFSGDARDLALFLEGDAPDLADWDESGPFARVASRLIKIFKERARGYRLRDSLLIYCAGINLKFAATSAFDSISMRLDRAQAEEFFSADVAPARMAPAQTQRARIVTGEALDDVVSAQTQPLQAAGRVRAPRAEWCLDLSRGQTVGLSDTETEITTAASALHRIHSHVVVRGTNMLLLPEDRLLPVRQLDPAAAREFANYLRTACNRSDQAESFHSNLYFQDDSIWLGEKDVVVVDDHLFVLTPDEYLNYGMWLLQAVPGLYLCEKIGHEGAILCPDALPWQKSVVDFVAPKASQRWVAHSPSLDYLSSGSTSFIGSSQRSFWVSDFQREAYAQLRERARGLDPGGRASGARRIYVSRFQHNATSFSNRVLVNEIELMLRLGGLGFEIVSPETMSFVEQVRQFADAEIVIGPGGAAMFNCVFCQPGATVVTIESNANWVTNHCRLFGSLDLNYAVVFGEQLDPAGGPHSPWRLDVDAFLSHVRPALGL